MPITHAQYTATGAITATINGQELTIPDDMANRHRKMLKDANVFIEAYVASPPTVIEVKDEAYRRITSICPEWKQRNLTAQAAILAEKGRDNWTADELAAWEAGEAIWSEIATIRAKSDEIELMDPIPQDYTEDKWWT